MRRYLNQTETNTHLNLGKTIEVFLGRILDDKNIISYLGLTKENDKIKVERIDHYDEGSLDFIDLYAFSYVDPNMEFETNNFNNINETVEFIRTKFNITEVKFLNAGIIQDEYADLIKSEG